MIGCDLAEIPDTGRRSRLNPRRLLKLYSKSEIQLINSSNCPLKIEALLWSFKESAYKAHSNPPYRFQPKMINMEEFDVSSLSGKIRYLNEVFDVNLLYSNEEIVFSSTRKEGYDLNWYLGDPKSWQQIMRYDFGGSKIEVEYVKRKPHVSVNNHRLFMSKSSINSLSGFVWLTE